MNTGAKRTQSGEGLELPNELLLLPHYTPLLQPHPSFLHSVGWSQLLHFSVFFFYFYISLYFYLAKLHIKNLI